MKLHEYQAKAQLRPFGVPVPEGVPAKTPDEAVAAAREVGGTLWVVKSQIHAGGRGKGRFVGQVSDASIAAANRGDDVDEGKGGVRLARTLDEVEEAARSMLGSRLVTKQTGAEGRTVHTVYIEAGCDIARELYLSVLLDRSNHKIMFMASQEGGMDIEHVAEHTPEKLFFLHVDSAVGFGDFQGRQLAYKLGITDKKAVRSAVPFFRNIYKAYMGLDCSMLEINPLVQTGAGDLIALDCKMDLDDNAMYRHRDLVELRDLHEEESTEIEASEFGLSFIKLDGNIGCMVNGAGLAMSTMDIIQFKGASPANFLDVGGGAQQEQVEAAFRIITQDPAVKGILVNIFGGIMKCDVIANGVIGAVKEVGLDVPLVVRLSGTNAELGKQILAESGLDLISTTNLDDAADAIVRAVKGA